MKSTLQLNKTPFLIKLAIISSLLFISFSVYSTEKGLGNTSPSKPRVELFVIDANKPQQTISNFSASDGWSMQYIGLWPKEKQEKMADWLFSTENDESGKPKGIGLSLWRFNIGAGSAEQGEKSQIGSVWTRAECFLNADGTYNWDKQLGQRNFMQLAKQRGVDQFLGFILSAPVYWTQNGLATNTGRGATFNLQDDKYADFARFMADVIEGIHKKEGILLDYICPFNEPDGHWNWVGPKQEGTAATNVEIAKTVRLTGSEFSKRAIKTKILVSESFDYNCMFRMHPYTKADRGYQIQSFFTKDSTNTYIGNVPNVPRMMVGHSYWTNTPIKDLRDIRVEMAKELKKNKVDFWQTELCIMSNDKEIGSGGGVDLTMKTALYVARIIHHDLVYDNASAWQWWRSVATGEYKDGLIYTKPDKTLLDGTFTDSKLMWALGNYSRFIRPGAKRLSITSYNKKGKIIPEGDTDPYAVMISAYENADKTQVIVLMNYENKEHSFDIQWKGKQPSKWDVFITSDNKGDDLAPHGSIKYINKITIAPRSIVTLFGL